MKLLSILATALMICASAFAQNAAQENHDLGYTDTPQLPGQRFKVHDPSRPHPHQVTPADKPGGAPSDATVLFDGKNLAAWQVRTPERQRPGAPKTWKVENGYMEVAPGASDLATKERFGNFQLHIEWAAPAEVRGNSQGRGNSGIFLQGLYEIQVLDDWNNPTYADGQAGAIYGQTPPLANPARKPGQWQTYDIVFEAPQVEDEKIAEPAYVTAFLNGVLLHNHKAVLGPTVHRQLPSYDDGGASQVAAAFGGPLVLQDHGNPVRYRNIWIRPIGKYDAREK